MAFKREWAFIRENTVFLLLKKTTPEEGVKVIRNLNIRKSCQTTDIPNKVIKLNLDILATFIYTNTSTTVHAELVPVHKKNCKRDRENYKPVSIISNFSKVYEKNLYSQLYNYFENILFSKSMWL